MKTVVWKYSCNGRDQRHPAFSPDFDGVCSAYFGCKRTYKTKKACEKAGSKHEQSCPFHGTVCVSRRIVKE